MMLGPSADWTFALLVGAVMVIWNFWHQFDEPSYGSSSEFFSKYKPRFATSHTQYARAKYEYILLFFGTYLLFSFAPAIFFVLAGLGAKQSAIQSSPTVIPVAIALALITFQKAPLTKDADRRIRALFHSLAQVPEGIRRTVAQIRDSEFFMDPDAITLQTRKLGRSQDAPAADIIENVLRDDQITRLWYRIGCILFTLSENRRQRTGIDLLFFESYKDELSIIASQHAQFAESVRSHIQVTRLSWRSRGLLSVGAAILAAGVMLSGDTS